jgi:hypothetical protein
MAGGPSHAAPTSDEDSELAHQTGQLSQTGGSASSSGTARRPSPDGRSSMRPTTTYDPKAVDEMIARKDALAMNATGSTSGLRTAQRVADGADQVQDHASKASSLDSTTGLPIASSVNAAALLTEATARKTAQQDSERQRRSVESESIAHERHEDSHQAVKDMRSLPEGSDERKKAALNALRKSVKTVIGHNNARRDALAAGRHDSLIKPMTMEHSVGETTPIALADGTVIDESLPQQVRQQKDARKASLKSNEDEIKARKASRASGTDDEFSRHVAALDQEKAGLEEDNQALRDQRDSRESARDVRKGYKYALTEDESTEYHSAREAWSSAGQNIEQAHKAHVDDLHSQISELEATGKQQKHDDRHRSGGRRKDKFSKKPRMKELEKQRDQMRTKQSAAIQRHLNELKKSRKQAGSKVQQQSLDDEISRHTKLLRDSTRDKAFVSPQFLSKEDQATLHSSNSELATLQREKDSGLTSEQQEQHRSLLSQLDQARADTTSGASEEDVRNRESHGMTVERFRHIKRKGVTPEETERKLANKERLLEIKGVKNSRLTEDEQTELARIKQERKDMKGLVKHSKAFAKKHEGEKVWQGRVGGVGTDHRDDRAVTSTKDSALASMNSMSHGLHSVGEVVEGDLEKGREAVKRGEYRKGQAIAVSGLAQNIGDVTTSAFGGGGVSELGSTIGTGMQGAGNVAGGATYAGADRAKFAQHARSMQENAEGDTARYQRVQHGIIDFHGSEDKPFEGGVGKGASQLLGLAHEQYGDQVSEGVSNALGGSPVGDLADRASSTASGVAGMLPGGLSEKVPDGGAVTDAMAEKAVESGVERAQEKLEGMDGRSTPTMSSDAQQDAGSIHEHSPTGGDSDHDSDAPTHDSGEPTRPSEGGDDDRPDVAPVPKKLGWWGRFKRWAGRKATSAKKAVRRMGSRFRSWFR